MRDTFRLRNHPLYWAFLLHRLSGIILAVFLPVHFWVLALALDGPDPLDRVLRWTDQPMVKFAEIGLVMLLSLHLAGGLRLLFVEFIAWTDNQKTLIVLCLGVSCGVGLLLLMQL